MTRTRLTKGEIGQRLAEGFEWLHFVSATALIYPAAGAAWVAIYFVLSSTIALIVPRGVQGRTRWLGLASPLGMLLLAISSQELSPAPVMAASVLTGLGHAALGRTSAFGAGLTDAVGRPAVVGAITAVVVMPAAGPVFTLTASALGMTLAALMGGVSGHSGPAPLILMPSLLGLGAVAGLRVLEPVLAGAGPAAHTVMATVWAVGAYLGSRSAVRSDARAVLSVPFVAAMALAAMAVVRGWGEIFLYGAVAGSVGLVGGAGGRQSDAKAMMPSRVLLLLAALLGGLFASRRLPVPGAPDETLLWPPAVALLTGAFVSLFSAYRLKARPEPEVAEEVAVEVETPTPTTETVPASLPAAEPSMTEVEAAQLLLDALKQARSIRAPALALLRSAPDPAAYAANRFIQATTSFRERLVRHRISISDMPTE